MSYTTCMLGGANRHEQQNYPFFFYLIPWPAGRCYLTARQSSIFCPDMTGMSEIRNWKGKKPIAHSPYWGTRQG